MSLSYDIVMKVVSYPDIDSILIRDFSTDLLFPLCLDARCVAGVSFSLCVLEPFSQFAFWVFLPAAWEVGCFGV